LDWALAGAVDLILHALDQLFNISIARLLGFYLLEQLEGFFPFSRLQCFEAALESGPDLLQALLFCQRGLGFIQQTLRSGTLIESFMRSKIFRTACHCPALQLLGLCKGL
jgi:hypothetical protein